jgi:Ribbon-helix-helix protein, copG family
MEAAMPSPIKFHAPLALGLEIKERSRKEGRSTSDVVLRAVQRGLAAEPPIEMPEAIVDVAERNDRGGRAVAAYLSKPLARAIRKLAEEEQRSESWTMRSLIRDGLRLRGLLPQVPDINTRQPQHVDVDATAA